MHLAICYRDLSSRCSSGTWKRELPKRYVVLDNYVGWSLADTCLNLDSYQATCLRTKLLLVSDYHLPGREQGLWLLLEIRDPAGFLISPATNLDSDRPRSAKIGAPPSAEIVQRGPVIYAAVETPVIGTGRQRSAVPTSGSPLALGGLRWTTVQDIAHSSPPESTGDQ
ncbi:hypothetical protein FB451DRAFT_1195485 [Mycena latifolia]|nr:hypothetical protein FB451DRAFT_1195485 [Mycena latifolia]